MFRGPSNGKVFKDPNQLGSCRVCKSATRYVDLHCGKCGVRAPLFGGP
jgi:hypothetical protein